MSFPGRIINPIQTTFLSGTASLEVDVVVSTNLWNFPSVENPDMAIVALFSNQVIIYLIYYVFAVLLLRLIHYCKKF